MKHGKKGAERKPIIRVERVGGIRAVLISPLV